MISYSICSITCSCLAGGMDKIAEACGSTLLGANTQDGHNEAWEEEYVANIVRREVARRGINTVRAKLLCLLWWTFMVA